MRLSALSLALATVPLDVLRDEVQAALSGDPVAWKRTLDAAGGLAVNLATALLIFVFTLWASRWVARLMRQALERIHRPQAPDATLQGFLSSMARWIVLIVGMMAVLEELGVKTTSVLALLGAGSLAIGLAMQGSLANVAAGVMLLVLRPYRVGDAVQINGKTGTVVRLDLFMTELADFDNLTIYLPNSKVFGDMIVNYSTHKTRRMELAFNVDFGDDLDTALAVLLDCAKADERILPDPAPWSGVTGLTDSAVTLTLRCWAASDVYWDARYALIKRVKERFQAAGMAFPYPHQVSIAKSDVPTAQTAPGTANPS